VIRPAPDSKLGAASEAAVVALAMSGDDAAFGELVRRRQDAIRHLFRRLTRDPALADDLAQQSFVQAWMRVQSLKSPAAFGAWLRKLAVNCWLQHARAAKHEVALADEMLPEVPGASAVAGHAAPGSAAPSVAEQAASTVAERLDLDAALRLLSPQQRLCVVLAYSGGMSHAEISESTAIPLGTVKSHVARGSARLRELLQGYGEPNER
jgi:RNA polymerase sigma-70 factor (ECF subfamily)